MIRVQVFAPDIACGIVCVKFRIALLIYNSILCTTYNYFVYTRMPLLYRGSIRHIIMCLLILCMCMELFVFT